VSNLLPRILRSLPTFPGKLRIAKLLLGNLAGSAQITDRFGFSYEVPNLLEPIAFHLLINGSYEPQVQDLILRTLQPGGAFLDVGANIGTFTIPAARRVGPSGRVVAIEGSPSVFSVLQKNIVLNDASNVQLVPAAAAASNHNVTFYPAPADHFGMGSRAPQFNATPITIPSVTLDSLVKNFNLPSVDLIKIDVEGFELDVLKGALELLKTERPPLVVFEFCDWAEARALHGSLGAAQRCLMELGFDIRRISDHPHGNPIEHPLTTGTEMLVAER
jgi:FkbM family methyltransferase